MKWILQRIVVILTIGFLIMVIGIPLPLALIYIWSLSNIDSIIFIGKIWLTSLICLAGFMCIIQILNED